MWGTFIRRAYPGAPRGEKKNPKKCPRALGPRRAPLARPLPLCMPHPTSSSTKQQRVTPVRQPHVHVPWYMCVWLRGCAVYLLPPLYSLYSRGSPTGTDHLRLSQYTDHLWTFAVYQATCGRMNRLQVATSDACLLFESWMHAYLTRGPASGPPVAPAPHVCMVTWDLRNVS
jgi:hypothetical protein